jgi:hypothetical protein
MSAIRYECIDVSNAEGMKQLESRLAEMLSCPVQRCSALRSTAFVKIRRAALYFPCPIDEQVVYFDGIKVILRASKQAEIFVLTDSIENEAEALGKRRSAPSDDDEEGDSCI